MTCAVIAGELPVMVAVTAKSARNKDAVSNGYVAMLACLSHSGGAGTATGTTID